MGSILQQALGFCVIIVLGYLLKRVGPMSKADGGVLSVIILTITLPAAIVVGLADVKITSILFILMTIGFVLNVIAILLGRLVWSNKPELQQKLLMYSVSGYNVGNFSLPFVQGFFPIAVPYLCMFDIGNAFMLAGGSPLLIDRLVGEKEKMNLPKIIRTLLKSIPFTTYLVMLVLRAFDISLTSGILDIFQLMSNANGFLSMLMIGLYLELRLPKQALSLVGKTLFMRYLLGILFAVLIVWLLPVDPMIKKVLALLCVSPIPTFSVINCVKAGIDEGTVGFTSSMSILISLVLMTGTMMILK